jgi:hypothetical protein
MHGICYSNVWQLYGKSMVTPRLSHLYPTSMVSRRCGICNTAVGLSIAGLQLFTGASLSAALTGVYYLAVFDCF